MASYGQSITVTYLAYNTNTGAYQTGDSANHTIKLLKDGTEASPTNSPAEVDSTNMPGHYSLVLTTAEAQHNVVVVGGKSTTANVIIIPITITFEQLPTAVAGAANGLLIAGTNAATTIDGLTLTGANAVTSTPATSGLTITGGAASTTGGGTAAPAISATGGAGAASTNGAASGATIAAGGTNTVSSTADGITITGTSNGNGMTLTHAGTGKDLNAQTTNALQVNATAINAVSTSSVTTVNANIGETQPINFTGTGASALVQCDARDINGVSASSVTTINANIGTTQPTNFTGTGASALVKADMQDIAGAAVSTSTAQIGVNLVNISGVAVNTATAQIGVNVVNIKGSASTGTAGYVGIDWSNIANKTAVVDLSNTTIENLDGTVAANVTQALGHAVTTTTNGILDVNTKNYNNQAAQTDANNLPKVDVEDWNAHAVLTPDTAGAPKLSAYDSLLIANGTGTATAGTINTITLQTALGHDNLGNGCVIKILSGTGAGQTRAIAGYVDSTQVVTADRNWDVTPNNTSVYAIYANELPGLNSSLLQSVNVGFWNGVAVPTPNVGGVPIVDPEYWDGAPIPAPNVAGIPKVDVVDVLGSPPTLVSFPTNFSAMSITAAGLVELDLTGMVPTTGNTANTIADCLNAARAQGFGVWKINTGTKQLQLFAPDGVTAVRTFLLDSVSVPTQRT